MQMQSGEHNAGATEGNQHHHFLDRRPVSQRALDRKTGVFFGWDLLHVSATYVKKEKKKKERKGKEYTLSENDNI